MSLKRGVIFVPFHSVRHFNELSDIVSLSFVWLELAQACAVIFIMSRSDWCNSLLWLTAKFTRRLQHAQHCAVHELKHISSRQYIRFFYLNYIGSLIYYLAIVYILVEDVR